MFSLKISVFLALLVCIFAPPVQKSKENEKADKEGEHGDDWMLDLEYGRYLKEVVQALESDPEFRKKLETSDANDIKSGKIARDLHFVDHNIRSQLDELKRRELERLRHLAVQEQEKKKGIDRTRLKIPTHLDHNNPTRFESEDLKKLILQLNSDLEVVDKKRQDEFKRYELEKQYEYKHELEGMTEEQKIDAVKKHEEQQQKHKSHPKLHHPGSKQQYEEVWQEQDHMKNEDFNPKTFFHVHDLDGNGYWDEIEVKALFQKELDKMYDPNASEDDQMERYEEMERMRAHIFSEADTNHDGLISFEEFEEQTKKQDFERDEGWQGLDEQELYSQQEYDTYEHQRQAEIQQLIDSGAIPPPPGYHGLPPNAIPMDHQGAPQGYQAVPQGYQAVPQGYQGVPQGYQADPQGYQGVPQGYQADPQGHQAIPQGHQAVPQGHQGVPQGYQAVPQGYQAVPQGHQGVPQGYQAASLGHQAVPQGYQAAPQGHQAVQQGYQALPHGQQALPISQGQAIPQAQPPVIQAASNTKDKPQQPPQGGNHPTPPPVPKPVAQTNKPPQPISQGQKSPGRIVKTPVDDNQPPGGIVFQNPQDSLDHPAMPPVDNHLPTN